MPLNLLQFLVYACGLVCCWLGRRVALRPAGGSIVFAIIFALLALPGVCYALYYLRIWEEPMWLYQVRSWPGSELLASLAGLLPGWVQGRLQGRWRVSFPSVSVLLLLGLAVPYVKQLSGPAPMSERWKDGVCLQSSPSTCGPASAATLLTAMGVPTSEADLARDSFSTWSGTENWYLRRAIERRGVSSRYAWLDPPVDRLMHPAIAGVKLGQKMGHFVAVLGEDAEGYVVADPMRGKFKLSKARLQEDGIRFSGFFLVLEKKQTEGQ